MKPSLPSEIETFSIPAQTRDRLVAYAELLTIWSARLNLVSRHDLPHLWPRHILDSLQLADYVPRDLPHAIDLGSGAGFPGLVLAIATGVPFHLVESDQRKSAFLREAARITGAPATIHPVRIESLTIAATPLVTARALAPLDRLLPLTQPLLAPNGTCLFLKGANLASELEAARQHWHMECDHFASRTSPDAAIIRIRNLRHV